MSVALALALQAAVAMPERQALGVFGRWGAFHDAAPARCYAIAEPLGRRRDQRPFASIATWPGLHAHNQLHVRLGRTRNPAARVTLAIGERRFQLIAGDRDAWAPDARTDVAIVAAMRAGRAMSVETVAATGTPFADTYPLRGAASAIDAAAVGCVPPR